MQKTKIPGYVGAVLGVIIGGALLIVSDPKPQTLDIVETPPPVVVQEEDVVPETVQVTEPVQEVLVDKPVDIVDNSVDIVEEGVAEEVAPVELDPEDLEILAIIIYQEAGSDRCSDDTRRKVGSVFLNRVNSRKFPDTFYEVATAKSQYGTLYWTGIKWPDRAHASSEAHAVQRAYDIAEELITNGSILPANVIWQAEFPQGSGIYCYQDNTYFCYSGVLE